MSWVEDGRKIFQDFLAPELRGITVRIESLEKIVEANEARAEKRFQSLESQIDKRFQAAERESDKRLQTSEAHIEKRFQTADATLEKRFQAAEATTEKRFQAAEAHFEKRFQSLHEDIKDIDVRSEKRHMEVLTAIGKLADYHAVLERLGRLEEKMSMPAQ